MYDYMRALEDRFTPEDRNAERRQELEAHRQAVATLLDKAGKEKAAPLGGCPHCSSGGNGTERFHCRFPSGLGDRNGAGYGRQIFLRTGAGANQPP